MSIASAPDSMSDHQASILRRAKSRPNSALDANATKLRVKRFRVALFELCQGTEFFQVTPQFAAHAFDNALVFE